MKYKGIFRYQRKMRDDWEMKKLGDIVFQDTESAVNVEPDKVYSMVGVYSFGKGLFNKGDLSGINSSYKTFYKLKDNHIVLSQLFGWEGAIALSSKEFEGKYVSSQFPTFLVNEKLADIRFVNYFLQQQIVWKKLFEVGKGMGSRRRTLNPHNLLNLDIPLQTLSGQQRIISKIENLKQKIREINKIRCEQLKSINYLRYSIYVDLQRKFKSIPIGKILIPQKEIVKLNPDKDYKQVTVKLGHKGVVLRRKIKSNEVASTQFLAKRGNFIISKIDARNGAMGILPDELDNSIVTNDFPLYSFSKEINPKFFYYFSNTIYFDEACKNASEGSTNRKRLKINKFENILIPLLSVKEQNQIVIVLDKLDTIKVHYQQIEKKLCKLFPALLSKIFKGELTTVTKFFKLSITQEVKKNYFVKRKVLATYIINQSLNDTQFGDTKFEKILHLSDYFVIKRNLNQKYIKKAAGPLDNKFSYPYLQQVEKSKWFIRRKEGTLNKFFRGINHSKSLNTYNYFSKEELKRVDKIIEYFKKSDYERPEIVSTLYAVWNNRLILKQEINDELLIKDFYDWDISKSKYKKDRLERALEWMRKENIIPDGWGKVIEKSNKSK